MIEAISNQLGGLPRAGVIALLVLLSIQIILQVVALVDLAKRRTVPGGKRWLWALVIVFGNLVGAVVYLAVARIPGPGELAPGSSEDAGTASRDALDRLYGSPPDKEKG